MPQIGEVIRLAQEPRYLRLIEGKVILVTEAEVMEEEVLARPTRLTDQDILVLEWNERIKRAEQLRERIGFIHQAMRDDDQRPSQYEPDYDVLWNQYRDAIESLRELDAESVSEFRDKVVARVKELEIRLNAMCGNWDPEGFDDFEQILACYEKNYDLMAVLQKVADGYYY